MGTTEPEIINSAFETVVGEKSYMQGFEASSSVRIQQLHAEFDARKRETENARKECNEVRARLVEVESQLEEKQTEFDAQKRETENARKECNEVRAGLVEVESQLEKHTDFDAQKRDTENAREECNEIRARLVEVESQLEEERLKHKEIEARLLDRQNEIQEINHQVLTAIQSALSQYLPPSKQRPHQYPKERFQSLKPNSMKQRM